MKRPFWKISIATATFACATLISFDWSAQQGVSLSVESAQARVGRPLTPVSVAGVARRQYRRDAYGYGAGAVGAGLAVGAIGAAAVAATSPWGYGRPYGYQGATYYSSDPNAAYASADQTWGGSSSAGGYYGESPWGYYECRLPHTYNCQPYSNIGWYR